MDKDNHSCGRRCHGLGARGARDLEWQFLASLEVEAEWAVTYYMWHRSRALQEGILHGRAASFTRDVGHAAEVRVARVRRGLLVPALRALFLLAMNEAGVSAARTPAPAS